MKNNKKELSQEQITVEVLEFSAKKLAFLLYASTMPEDIKEAWINVLPEMTLEQIDKFIEILEAKYLNEQTKDIDEKFLKKIENVFGKWNKNVKECEKKEKSLLIKIKTLSNKV